MLKNVVPPEVASLSIGIFLITVSLDYVVSMKVINWVMTSYNVVIGNGT